MKTILLTGGGTAGHVTPNLALLPALRAAGYEIAYAGSIKGMEQELVSAAGLPYHGIASGKLRRYLDVKNITDMFRVVKGLGDAFALMRRLKPDIVFSKGGYVTVPIVMAARMNGIPAVIHESDFTPGLANRLAIPFARKVCVNFPETLERLPKGKAVLTGTPIRASLFEGDRFKATRLCGFEDDGKPVILFTGGSLGAAAINNSLRAALPRLLKRYRIIHLCGKGNLAAQSVPGYAQFEYVTAEQPHLFALADLAVSRAGANTIFELLALTKPHLLIPLTKNASRGDQLLNAASFERMGYSAVLQEENLTEDTLIEAVDLLYNKRKHYIANMTRQTEASSNAHTDGIDKVMRVIKALSS